jgi:predicted  nucleic acid-binding Zn-ribbon protein
MRVTAIRIRKLVSREVGYGNDAAEFEAEVEAGDDLQVVADKLHQLVGAEIAKAQGRDELIDNLADLQDQLTGLSRQLTALKAEIEENDRVIAAHEELAELARERGIRAASQLNPIPF